MKFSENIFDNASCAQNGTVDSVVIPIAVEEDAPLWKFTFQWEFTSAGAATMKFEVLTSIDGANFHNLDTDIVTGAAKDTVLMADFDPTFCHFVKIRGTEENTAAVTGLYGSLAMG